MDDFLNNNGIKSKPEPFIRWAGGKRWLANRIDNFLPLKFNNYHEPFLGGGAIYFHIQPKNHAFLSDLNFDLINAFQQIKQGPLRVIEHLDNLENSEHSYYEIRAVASSSETFNAAKFIFLNKTCYNGIYRVNNNGVFNVPYGHNASITVYELDNILAVSSTLKRATIKCQDFSEALNQIEKGDFVFLDPPYTVAHNNNGFIEYNQKIFTWTDQERLADMINIIRRKGAYFILTNAVHDSIVKLYDKLGKRYELDRHSTITSQIGKRKKRSEYLITNCI